MNDAIGSAHTPSLGEDAILVQPIVHSTRRFYILTAVLLGVTGLGIFAYCLQYRNGLGVTGLNRPVYWGVYITNFVFFIGISHAGTLISAILRIVSAEWRRTITRSAEVITVMVLLFGVGNILIDLGRPDRMLNVVKHGHLQSPLLWDVCSITTYLICSTVYLYLPLIPDIAILRDNIANKHWLYRMLALGWKGTPRQWRILHILMSVMAIVVIPVAVSVHTVVSFVFAMTIQPMWHSAIFGPYFVAGAIFSGVAALIVAMAIIRWAYHLEGYFKPIHFNYLGILLLVMSLLWLYFTLSEFLTTFYGHEPIHMKVFNAKLFGPYAPYFWTMVLTCFVLPFIILSNRKTRTVAGTVIASISVNIGMYLERYIIVVPSLSNPRLPRESVSYTPTWVEWCILAGCFSTFMLLYVLFTKFFPIVSIWEVKEGREKAVAEVSERIRQYLPSANLSEPKLKDALPT
ncbi:MAG: polysulfide reductase NrfD [Planctomycetes bacterium]|nr:polysulfide reductase NrfD [Planctomycetota bacterium]